MLIDKEVIDGPTILSNGSSRIGSRFAYQEM